MGQEIVYCSKCQTRLKGSDFESGGAFRIGDKVACSACAVGLLAALPQEEQQEILNHVKSAETKSRTPPPTPLPKTARLSSSAIIRAMRPPATPPPGRGGSGADGNKLPLIVGGAAGLVALGVIVALATGGGKPPPGVSLDSAASRSAATAPGPATNPEASDAALLRVRALLNEARRFAEQNPDRLAEQIKKLEDLAFPAERVPSLLAEVRRDIETVRQKLRLALAAKFAQVDVAVEPLVAREEFSAALNVLDQARAESTDLQWRGLVEKKEDVIRAKIEALLEGLKAKFLSHPTPEMLSDARQRIAHWGVRFYHDLFEKDIAAKAATTSTPTTTPAPTVPPTPSPSSAPSLPAAPDRKTLSKEFQAYLARWDVAMDSAAAGDFARALNEIEAAVKSAKEAPLKAEAASDREALRLVQTLVSETHKILSDWPPGKFLSLEIFNETGARTAINDAPFRIESGRIVFRGAADFGFIDFSDLTPTSRATPFRSRPNSDGRTDGLACAFYALLRGDMETALQQLAAAPDTIPGKYWEWAKRSRQPKPNARELDARRALYAAEQEFLSSKTRGSAAAKFRDLSKFSDTAYFKANQEFIEKRRDYGKEYLISAERLRGTGIFKLVKAEGARIEPQAWIAEADVDRAGLKKNFVDVAFVATGAEYRCWIYLGACCQDVARLYLQATNLSRGNMDFSPGSGSVLELKPPSNLSSQKHSSHAKRPQVRWEWHAVALPRYSEPGLKVIRLMAERQGVSIACALVSSTRSSPPAEAEIPKLKTLAPPPEDLEPLLPDNDGATAAWMIAGPIEPDNVELGYDKDYGPESKLDFDGSFKDDKGKIIRWKRVNAIGYIVDFRREWGDAKDIAYAASSVYAPREMDVFFGVGSDDTIKIWLNGKLIHNNPAKRGVKLDDDWVPGHLKRGWNPVLIKVDNRGGVDWGMAFRVADVEQRRPIAGVKIDPLP